MTTPTQNSIPSSTAIDVRFNAEKLDEIVNSDEDTYSDRFGNSRFTLKGLATLVNDFFTTVTGVFGYDALGKISSYEKLKLAVPTKAGTRVFLSGYTDGSSTGIGEFVSVAGTATDDGGTICVPTGSTSFYWKRIIYNNLVSPEFFNIVPDSRRNAPGTDYGVALNNYFKVIIANNYTADFPSLLLGSNTAEIGYYTTIPIVATGLKTMRGDFLIHVKSSVFDQSTYSYVALLGDPLTTYTTIQNQLKDVSFTVRDLDKRAAALNGIYVKYTHILGGLFRGYDLQGTGVDFAPVYDSKDISVITERCGTTSAYAFDMRGNGDECNTITFSEILCHDSYHKGIRITGSKHSILRIHAEANAVLTTDDGFTATDIGLKYCNHFIYMTAGSIVEANFNDYDYADGSTYYDDRSTINSTNGPHVYLKLENGGAVVDFFQYQVSKKTSAKIGYTTLDTGNQQGMIGNIKAVNVIASSSSRMTISRCYIETFYGYNGLNNIIQSGFINAFGTRHQGSFRGVTFASTTMGDTSSYGVYDNCTFTNGITALTGSPLNKFINSTIPTLSLTSTTFAEKADFIGCTIGGTGGMKMSGGTSTYDKILRLTNCEIRGAWVMASDNKSFNRVHFLGGGNRWAGSSTSMTNWTLPSSPAIGAIYQNMNLSYASGDGILFLCKASSGTITASDFITLATYTA